MKEKYEVLVEAILVNNDIIQVYSLGPIMEWCEENEIKEYTWEKIGRVGNPMLSFKFTTESDAMAFKLRWS